MYMIIPGLAIFITVMAFNLFGDGLRDALDPRSSQVGLCDRCSTTDNDRRRFTV